MLRNLWTWVSSPPLIRKRARPDKRGEKVDAITGSSNQHVPRQQPVQVAACPSLPFWGPRSGHFLTMWSGESKLQLLNGNRQTVRENAKTDGQKRSETDTSKRRAKNANTVENKRQQAENHRRAFVVFAISQWPYSGGHLGFSCRGAKFFWCNKAIFSSKKITFGWNLPSFLVLFFPCSWG